MVKFSSARNHAHTAGAVRINNTNNPKRFFSQLAACTISRQGGRIAGKNKPRKSNAVAVDYRVFATTCRVTTAVCCCSVSNKFSPLCWEKTWPGGSKMTLKRQSLLLQYQESIVDGAWFVAFAQIRRAAQKNEADHFFAGDQERNPLPVDFTSTAGVMPLSYLVPGSNWEFSMGNSTVNSCSSEYFRLDVCWVLRI